MWGTKREKLLWERSDQFLKVQVWEKPDRRELRFGNHIMQSVFSRNLPDYLVLPYTRFMLLGLLFHSNPQSVLHIGLGAGSVPKWLYKSYPDLQQTIIELSPAVIEASYRFFELPQTKQIKVLNFDATRNLTVFADQFDLIFLDAFNDDGVPSEIAKAEFLQLMRSYLSLDGWLVGNTWTSKGDFEEQCKNWRSIFDSVYQARANHKGNVILFGNRSGQFPDLEDMALLSRKLQKTHQIEFTKMLKEIKKVD